jgi:hypothetical protein
LKLVIKHTFLEYVGDEKTLPTHRRNRRRAVTDPSIFDDLCYGEVRKLFHDSSDVTPSSSSGSTCGDESPYSDGAVCPLGELETPEGTPLHCHAAAVSFWWPEEEWSVSFLPEAVGQRHTWPDHCGDEDWWASVAYDAGMVMPGDCSQQLATIYEQYHASCESVEQEMQSSREAKETRTTVMMRDLPESFTRTSLLRLLSDQGFFGRFDFLYLPVDFKRHQNLGYALINLVSPSEALRFCKHFDGFSRWDTPTERICKVSWCSPQQGLEAHVERYRNSPVMHASVPEDWRPLLLTHAVPIAFPAPTQKIKAPKVKGMNL